MPSQFYFNMELLNKDDVTMYKLHTFNTVSVFDFYYAHTGIQIVVYKGKIELMCG